MNATNELPICEDYAPEKKITLVVYWDVCAVNKQVA